MAKKRRPKRYAKLRLGILLLILGISAGALYLAFNSSSLLSQANLSKQDPISAEARKKIAENPDGYPERLLTALENNAELTDFALDYPEKVGQYDESITVSPDNGPRSIPLFLQWDPRWGYAYYGDGVIGLDGCGPTCLSMVLIGLTGDSSLHPKRVADFSMQNGYVTEAGTQWALMTTGASALGLYSSEVPLDENRMAQELSAGHPIICSVRPGDFTTTGHFIVLCGYEDGNFLVNDPNSRSRSEKRWSYDRLSGQIKAMWSFSTE